MRPSFDKLRRLPKYERSQGKQTYRCGDCHYHFTPDGNQVFRPEAVKEQAVATYCEGSSLRAMRRVLEALLLRCTAGSKKALQAQALLLLLRRMRAGKKVRVVALDEMWTYVRGRRGEKRQPVWVWTAVWEERDGSLLVDFEVSDRSEATFLKLYEVLPEAERYCSDGYEAYEWLPRDRHEVEKGGPVNWNEGLHSRLRSG